MPRESKADMLKRVHSTALNEFDNIQSVMKDERQQCLNDRRFYSIAGAQWEGNLSDQFENKPKLEVNKVHLSVMRIINEYRNNRITVNFLSKEGDEYDELADTCDGLYRADEQDSVAEEAYDNAFEEAVGGGFGAWRLRSEYEDEEDEDNDYQRIRIEPIFDADTSVFFDLNAKRQDKSDAQHCFVITSMTVDTYKDKYDDDPATWPKEISAYQFDWATPDFVYLAEYYVIEETTELIRIFTTIDGETEKYSEAEFEADDMLEETLFATGSKETGSRRVKRKKVHKYIMSGGKVIEDCGYIAGKCIPIIPVYGKRWFVDNVERCMGHVRLARDPQMLKNMQLSKLAETSAQSSVEKPILHPEQIAGHEMMWTEDNIKDYPYLLVNTIEDMNGNTVAGGPVAYTKPPQIPPALAALLQLTEQDMKDILGDHQAAERIASNISGEAMALAKEGLDMQTFIYMSNMAKAIKRSGEVWLSMARDIFVEPGRKMKIIGLQDEISSVKLIDATIGEDGEIKYKNDLSEAKFDIIVDVGPTSSTKRRSTVRDLTEMMRVISDPQDMKVISSMILMNMEGEGIGDVRDYYRKQLVNMGVIKPTEEEAAQMMAQMQNQEPDAQTQYLMAEARNAEAKAMKAQADTTLTLVKAEETQAKTAETLAGIDRDDREQAINAAKAMNEALNQ